MNILKSKITFDTIDEIDNNDKIISTWKFVQAEDLNFYTVRILKESNTAEVTRFPSYKELMNFKNSFFEIYEVQ